MPGTQVRLLGFNSRAYQAVTLLGGQTLSRFEARTNGRMQGADPIPRTLQAATWRRQSLTMWMSVPWFRRLTNDLIT